MVLIVMIITVFQQILYFIQQPNSSLYHVVNLHKHCEWPEKCQRLNIK